MASDNFIDLGKKYDSPGCCEPVKKGKEKIYYPSLYLSGVEGLKLETGEIEFRAKGRVVSISMRENEDDGEKWGAEIEVHSISAPGAVAEDDEDDDTEEALDKSISDATKKRTESDDE